MELAIIVSRIIWMIFSDAEAASKNVFWSKSAPHLFMMSTKKVKLIGHMDDQRHRKFLLPKTLSPNICKTAQNLITDPIACTSLWTS